MAEISFLLGAWGLLTAITSDLYLQLTPLPALVLRTIFIGHGGRGVSFQP